MRVLLAQLDGKLPNLALLRIAAHHRAKGDEVELCFGAQFEHGLWGHRAFDRVYGSAIFRKTIPLAERLLRVYPEAILGGTGVDPARKKEVVPLSPAIRPHVTAIEDYGVTSTDCAYEYWPQFQQSIGFTQRGCRLNCEFCCVPTKEGRVRQAATISDIWRGDPWPREILLLDNDFFGQPNWRDRVSELRDGSFKVSFIQGINCRCLTEEAAEAIASLDYRDDSMRNKRVYTAWDNKDDEHRLFAGLDRLVKHGIKPDHIMVYMICGFWPGETHEDRDQRRSKLRAFGARPYPMPYSRTPELVGFQRWVIGAYDKRVSWARWKAAGYQPSRLGFPDSNNQLNLEGLA